MLSHILGLTRIETLSNDEMNELLIEKTHSVYKHEALFLSMFTLEVYIEADLNQAYNYLSKALSIAEWSYSLRSPIPNEDGSWLLMQEASNKQPLNCRLETHREAGVIDLHWSTEVGLLYSDALRLVPAEQTIKKEGTVLLWCCIPNGNVDNWLNFPAQRKIEMQNIKHILEAKN